MIQFIKFKKFDLDKKIREGGIRTHGSFTSSDFKSDAIDQLCHFSIGKKGFEPLTPWFVATCSNPLSYKPKFLNYLFSFYFFQIK